MPLTYGTVFKGPTRDCLGDGYGGSEGRVGAITSESHSLFCRTEMFSAELRRLYSK